MASKGKSKVVIAHGYQGHKPGETVSLDHEEAARLIRGGYARKAEEEKDSKSGGGTKA